MNTPFYQAKFGRLTLDHDKYLVEIDSKGVFLTRTCGSGDEKDCDAEMTWDEIYESCHVEIPLPSKATVDYLAKMEKNELVEALRFFIKYYKWSNLSVDGKYVCLLAQKALEKAGAL